MGHYTGGFLMGLAPLPPGYILSSSDATLESLELSRLNAVSNLRKELHQVVEEWIEAEVQARVARLMRQSASIENLALDVEFAAVSNFPSADVHAAESLSRPKSQPKMTKPERCAGPATMFASWHGATEIESAPADTMRCTRLLPTSVPEDQTPPKTEPQTASRSREPCMQFRAGCATNPTLDRARARKPRMLLTTALKRK